MAQFLLAFGTFIALHSIPAIPKIRGALIGRMGHGSYIAAYSIISTAALAWLVLSALSLDYVEIWQPRPWRAWPTFVLSPIGLFLVLAGLFSRNPFSISFRKGVEADAIVAVTRHPVLWGFLLVGGAHSAQRRSAIAASVRRLCPLSAGGFLMLEKGRVGRWGRPGRWPLRRLPSSRSPLRSMVRLELR